MEAAQMANRSRPAAAYPSATRERYAVATSDWQPLDGTRRFADLYELHPPREWVRFEIVYTPKTSS
jgi:hypothetical protein